MNFAHKEAMVNLVHFEDGNNPAQLGSNETFADLFAGINTTNGVLTTTDYHSNLVFVGEAAYPYGYRRGFYGPQTTRIGVPYLANLTDTFYAYIDELQGRGENPYSASFVLQYMFPGFNSHLPKSDDETAWPHSVVGHQTLFTPAYMEASNDKLTLSALQAVNQITYDRQHQLGEFLGNYPNYISPGDSRRRVWGDNVQRLIVVKQKYDPKCLIRNGRVFASEGCVSGGWGNVFNN